jgi:hypothetical protein
MIPKIYNSIPISSVFTFLEKASLTFLVKLQKEATDSVGSRWICINLALG